MKFDKEYSSGMLKNKRNLKTQRKNSYFCKAHDTIIYLSYLFLLNIATFALVTPPSPSRIASFGLQKLVHTFPIFLYFLGFSRFVKKICSHCILADYNLALNKYEGDLASKFP